MSIHPTKRERRQGQKKGRKKKVTQRSLNIFSSTCKNSSNLSHTTTARASRGTFQASLFPSFVKLITSKSVSLQCCKSFLRSNTRLFPTTIVFPLKRLASTVNTLILNYWWKLQLKNMLVHFLLQPLLILVIPSKNVLI